MTVFIFILVTTKLYYNDSLIDCTMLNWPTQFTFSIRHSTPIQLMWNFYPVPVSITLTVATFSLVISSEYMDSYLSFIFSNCITTVQCNTAGHCVLYLGERQIRKHQILHKSALLQIVVFLKFIRAENNQ